MGGKIYPKIVPGETTHLISDNVASRSLSFLLGLSGGLWILRSQYIEDSFAAKKFLPEEQYELKEYDANGNGTFVVYILFLIFNLISVF